MNITWASSSERRDTVTIFCDGEPWREVHTTIFGKKPSLPSSVTSPEALEETFFRLEVQMAKRYAMRRLAAQHLLSDALARSLKERFVSSLAIEAVISALTDLGGLNDQAWTESFVRVQSSRKVGPRAIAQKLAAKGVRGERLREALGEVLDEEGQKEQILQLLQGRFKARDLCDPRERQKVIAALVRRGFELSMVLSALEKGQ